MALNEQQRQRNGSKETFQSSSAAPWQPGARVHRSGTKVRLEAAPITATAERSYLLLLYVHNCAKRLQTQQAPAYPPPRAPSRPCLLSLLWFRWWFGFSDVRPRAAEGLSPHLLSCISTG